MEKLYGWYESAVALRPLVSRGIRWTRTSVKPKPLPIFYMLWSTSGIRSKNRNRERAKYILEWIIVMWRKGVYHLTEKSVWGVQSKLKITIIGTFFLYELNTKKRRICEVEVWNQYNWSMIWKDCIGLVSVVQAPSSWYLGSKMVMCRPPFPIAWVVFSLTLFSLLSFESLAQARLQHSPYFCVFKYARTVKLNLERGWKRRAKLGLTLRQTNFEKKNPDCFAGSEHRLGPVQTPHFSWAKPNTLN